MSVSANSTSASKAFSKQSLIFDSLEKENQIIQWMRSRVHNHCASIYKPGETLLELNCGTGIDAIYFSSLGLKVLATDISEGMLNRLNEKIKANSLEKKIETLECSFLDLEKIKDKKFNHVFSNFGGLNCTDNLKQVISQIDELLLPGGTATLVIMPRICPWEILLVLKGNFKTAFRRLKKNGSISHVEGVYFKTYYYSSSQVKKYFGNTYRMISLNGLASVAPPPYLEKFPKKIPRLFKFLINCDKKLSAGFPFNRWADHFMITMQKNSPV